MNKKALMDKLAKTIIDGDAQAAGPCTEMILYESAVGMMNSSSSGWRVLKFQRNHGSVQKWQSAPLA